MELKNYSRPNYKMNPIFEVVCQLRFPPILRILESPTKFQDTIRQEYPEYSVSDGLPEDLPKEVRKVIAGNTKGVTHNFLSEDGVWRISLGTEFIALANSGKYSSFEDFEDRLNKIIKSFEAEYKPSSYTRVGLRYKNLIVRTVFPNVSELSWNQIIPQNVSPEMHDEDIGDGKVTSFDKNLLLKEGFEKINIIYSFSRVSGSIKGENIENEQAYIIDIDSFTEKKIYDTDAISATIKSCKQNIQNIFRHSITEQLHKTLESG